MTDGALVGFTTPFNQVLGQFFWLNRLSNTMNATIVPSGVVRKVSILVDRQFLWKLASETVRALFRDFPVTPGHFWAIGHGSSKRGF